MELAKGQTTAEVCRRLGISERAYYRWRKEYGSLRVDKVRRLKDLEIENARLKKLVADQVLDLAIMKAASFKGKFRDECLNREALDTVLEGKVLIEHWRREYNRVRPSSALDYRPPAPEAILPLPPGSAPPGRNSARTNVEGSVTGVAGQLTSLP